MSGHQSYGGKIKDHQSFVSQVDQFLQVKSAALEILAVLAKWVNGEALPWLWQELGGVIHTSKRRSSPTKNSHKKLGPMAAASAIQQGLFVSIPDQNKKLKEPNFYHAQLTMLDSEARRYCDVIAALAKSDSVPYTFATVETLYRGLVDTVSVASVLLEDAGRNVTEEPGYFGAWRRQYELPFEVFKATEQIVYGTYSGLTHIDRAPYMPIAVLRTAVELRLRSAFGVYYIEDSARPHDILPIDLNKLFEAIQEHQDAIEFSVNIHDVWKIYRWSNLYVHSGLREYPWVPGFVLQYLRKLFSGEQKPSGWHMNNGIRMKRKTWHAVRKSVTATFTKSNAGKAVKRRRINLSPCDEKDAQCVFSDPVVKKTTSGRAARP